MITLANTTYYPAILLRKRWLEGGAERGGAFDIVSELGRLHAEPPLNSLGVSELERWSAESEAAQARQSDLASTTNEMGVVVPAALPVPTVRRARTVTRRERQPASLRRRFPAAHRGVSPAGIVAA